LKLDFAKEDLKIPYSNFLFFEGVFFSFDEELKEKNFLERGLILF